MGEVWLEELVLMNHANEAVEHEIAVLVETDFADLFEVKTGATRDRTIDADELERGVCFRYVRERFSRETRISWDAPAELELSVGDGSPGGPRPQAEIRFRARLEPHASWTTTLIEASGSPVGSRAGPHAGSFDAEAQRLREEVLAWRSAAPSLETDWEPLRLAYERSLDDLAALRFRPHEDRPRPCRRPACRGSWRCSAATA